MYREEYKLSRADCGVRVVAITIISLNPLSYAVSSYVILITCGGVDEIIFH